MDPTSEETTHVVQEGRGKTAKNKQNALDDAIAKRYRDKNQEDAIVAVEALRAKHVNEVFKLKAPGRPEITDWISIFWYDLSAKTIASGFSRLGLQGDTSVANEDTNIPSVSDTVDELVKLRLTEETVESDDDIDQCEDRSDNE
ncbi:hypothetical protein PI124_g18867 [Phytophthora idaei]|nr:hypothetical protein PI125_g19767 [Phytophthora idaei]KAG3135532.1 hypothetical protein PI126_g18214 [Phytophthora idaei]KAG3236125.1 hypothetical protein PI124_g18867 [Phytophthora idaei]